MRLTFKLFLLEIKRIAVFIPRLLIGCVLLTAVVCSAVALSQQTDESTDTKLTIAYYKSDSDSDFYVSMLINMVSEMDSVKDLCTFVPASSKQQIYDDIALGKIYGGIIFPESYVQGIMRGENNPAVIIIPKGRGELNPVFQQLVSIGSDMLVSVQAGIYAVNDCNTRVTKENIRDINMAYINSVLNRNKLFRQESWSAFGTLSSKQYYCGTGLAMLCLLCGICFGFMFNDYGKGFADYCRLWGYNGFVMLLLKQLLVMMFMTALFVTPAMVFINKAVPFININRGNIFVAVVISSQIITGIYYIFGSSGTLILALFSVVSGFLSGCFIPLVYLSSTYFERVCHFIPSYYMAENFLSLYSYNSNVNTQAIVCIPVLYAILAVCMAVKGGRCYK